MVNGFEQITKPLSQIEFDVILPYIADRLKHNIGESKAVKAKKIIEIINNKQIKKENGKAFKLTGPRFRQIIHHIRVKSIVPNLIATHKGYYVAKSKREVEDYIESLKQRTNSFEETRKAMFEYFIIHGI